MIINPDGAVAKHCAHQNKALQDQIKMLKADTAKDAETISSLRHDRDRYKSELEEDDVHAIKDGTCL
jgi:multidrug resistance efflux pump